ncbi:MAG: hypothetical protein JO012_13150 [Hyphomicrobiales bacterium]|nr:hypothetical protein [Hyphomicrobiales bacterium]
MFAAIERAAAPINSRERPRFFEAMAVELEKHPTLGEGVVYRACANLQRTFSCEARREVERTATARHLERRQRRDADDW